MSGHPFELNPSREVRSGEGSTVHLAGQGPNPHWNVHRSLEQLQGLQSAGLLLLQKLDKHLAQRDSGGGNHPEMLGTATAAILLTSYGVEIAIKTLLAQINPNERPPHGHDLLDLFDALGPDTKMQTDRMLKTLPAIGQSDWVGELDIRESIKSGSGNFTDWRYISERPGVGGGVPKVLINVVQALRAVCLELALPKE